MMNANRIRMRELASAPVAAVAMAAFTAAAWFLLHRELTEVRAEHAALLAEHAAVGARAAHVADLQRELDRSLAVYSRLVAYGVIGEEQRTEWIGFMTRLKSEGRIRHVKYAIEPQRVLAPLSPEAGIADVELRASRVELDLRVTHEGDLLEFFSGLHRVPGAWLLPRACTLRRASPAAEDIEPTPGLHALCSIDFVTLHDRRRREGTAP